MRKCHFTNALIIIFINECKNKTFHDTSQDNFLYSSFTLFSSISRENIILVAYESGVKRDAIPGKRTRSSKFLKFIKVILYIIVGRVRTVAIFFINI